MKSELVTGRAAILALTPPKGSIEITAEEDQ
jgi:hypothetical protein